MFSKSQIKFIKSLSRKKFRRQHGLFIAEGKKGISELLDSSLRLHSLYSSEDIFSVASEKVTFLKEDDLKKISNLSTPQTAVGIFHIPEQKEPELKGLSLALDDVQDPGNLGTIIRMCDWFGVENLICSEGTVDAYNPKVVQATMGSIARVNVFYTSLPEFLKNASEKFPVYGAFLEGKNAYTLKVNSEGILVMGNEANGITPEVASVISEKISIPNFRAGSSAESLNVATATAILLSEFRRGDFTGK